MNHRIMTHQCVECAVVCQVSRYDRRLEGLSMWSLHVLPVQHVPLHSQSFFLSSEELWLKWLLFLSAAAPSSRNRPTGGALHHSHNREEDPAH